MADRSGSFAPRGPVGLWRATRWSLQGLRAAWRFEAAFRLEVYALLLTTPLALWLGSSAVERALLIGSWLLILGAELLNSAIEALIERYGAEHHELAGRAKDLGSAAVFVLSMNVALVWGLIALPQLASRLNGM